MWTKVTARQNRSRQAGKQCMEALDLAALHKLLRHTVQLAWHMPGTDPRLGTRDGMGSGVLLHYNGQPGILTAGHCLHLHPKMNCAAVSHQPGGLSAGRAGIARLIPKPCLDSSTGEMNWGKRGDAADIAFVPVDIATRSWIETNTDGVFLNVAKQRIETGDIAIYLAVGHVGEYATKLEELRGGEQEQIVAKALQVRKYPRSRGKLRGGYKLIDLQIQAEATSDSIVVDMERGMAEDLRRITLEPANHWGGMSGGGVWLCAWRPEGEMVVELGGLVFYQDLRNGETILRMHDREGIKKVLDEATES